MSWKSFVGFVKHIFESGHTKQAGDSSPQKRTNQSSFDHVLNTECHRKVHPQRGRDVLVEEARHSLGSVSHEPSVESGDPTQDGESRYSLHPSSAQEYLISNAQLSHQMGKSFHPGKKFYPLKAYRQMASLAPESKGYRLTSPIKGPESGYPLRVNNSLTLAKMRHGTGSSRMAAGSTAATGASATDLGRLSAGFESGEKGVEAVGYDRNGGTSYGLYQMASRPGSVDGFIKYLAAKEPKWAARLKAAGPADTGSTRGRMPRVWKAIAQEDPKRFAELQQDFVETRFHQPAVRDIQRRTGLYVDGRSKALQEVLWSTAVQHGPVGARKIFVKAIRQLELRGREITDRALIERVYGLRERHTGGLGDRIKAVLTGRFKQEKNVALAMLSNNNLRA